MSGAKGLFSNQHESGGLHLTRDVEEEETTVPPSTTSSTTVITAVLVVVIELEEELEPEPEPEIVRLFGSKNTQPVKPVKLDLYYKCGLSSFKPQTSTEPQTILI